MEHEHGGSHTHSKSSGENFELWLPVSIFAAGLLIAGSIIYVGRPGGGSPSPSYGTLPDAPAAPGAAPAAPVPTPANVAEGLKLGPRDTVLGDSKAKVTVIEYSDYQCSFCHRYHTTVMPSLKSNYIDTGKVKFVYRHYSFLGPESVAAAAATECARDQGKFLPFHEAVMDAEVKDGQGNNGSLSRDLFVGLARTLGLNVDKFSKCVDDGTHMKTVADQKAAADAIGVSGTPKTFINGEAVSGAQPFEAFDAVIKKYL